MVNTFLPVPSYKESAKLLDRQRLGKQRVECLQILKANLGVTKGWQNHPAAKMWRGHELELAKYGLEICTEWGMRGYKDTVHAQIVQLVVDHADKLNDSVPPWLGDEDFHRSHQSNLKRKDPVHYAFDVPDDLPYVWPV